MFHLRKFRKFIISELNDYMVTTKVISHSKPLSQINSIDIPKPSCEELEKYLNLWNTLENYNLQEIALNRLFLELAPTNTNISDILLKTATLNDFYSTNIFSIFPVAQHILSLNIDNRLINGDISLVDDIKTVYIKDKKKEFYSFATKYCSHHNAEEFHIYDSYVHKVLCHFRNIDRFSYFNNNDLKCYEKFKNILYDFQSFYGLDSYTLKELDRYLWQLGKEYFKKK